MKDGNHESKIHIVGIGGAGMSAIAKILFEKGYQVSGSDIKESRYTLNLRKLGISVFIGHNPGNVKDADLVVYSTAIPTNNCELKEARKIGTPVLHRSEIIGDLTKDRDVIAITGTHGKTTTTSLASHTFLNSGINAGFLVGGELNDIGTNASCGKGKYFIVEADESDKTFLFLNPKYALVTNLEDDHLENYGNFELLKESFKKFIDGVSDTVFLCNDDRNLRGDLKPEKSSKIVTYGFNRNSDFKIFDLTFTDFGLDFKILDRKRDETVRILLPLKGKHNASNAAGVYALSRTLGIEKESIKEAFLSFLGVSRRFELKASFEDVDIIDDYAHHPTEIKVTIEAAKNSGYGRVIVVFQPHRYTRVDALLDSFSESFESADVIVATDIYSAGEKPIPGVTGQRVFEKIAEKNLKKPLAYIPRNIDIPRYVRRISRPGDAILFLGAGDVTITAKQTVRQFLEDKKEINL